MKIKELINYGKRILNENNIEDSSIIARSLAEYVLQMDRIQITVNEEKQIEEKNKHRYYLALIKIIQGTPLQYITNIQEFMKMNFYVDENVLIPQPDTEILVEEVIRIAKNINKNVEILDICTGSGCIATSIAKNIENSRVTMSDISSKALEIAKKNYEENISEKNNPVEFIESDMFEKINDKYDIIVSNPPYIESEEIQNLPEDVKKEPYIALDGGEDGLDFYKILILEAPKHLKETGYLCMEIGYNQKDKILNLLKENGKYKEMYFQKDLSGNDRIVIAKI